MAVNGFRVFDAHMHLQPWHLLKPAVREAMERGRRDLADIYRYQSDGDAFEAFLTAQGVDRAVMVNYVSPDVMGFPRETNDWIARYAKGRDRLLAVGAVHPRVTPDVTAEVDRLVGLGIRALKVHPSHQVFYPHAYVTGELPGLRDVYAGAERHGLPVIVHTGTSVFPGARNRFADPIFVDDVAIDFPDLKLLVAHVGRPLWMDTAFFLARRHPNVYLDLSGIPPARLLEYVPRLGDLPDKLVFGTDWPGPGVRSIRENVEAFLAIDLPEETKRKALWDNAVRVFGA